MIKRWRKIKSFRLKIFLIYSGIVLMCGMGILVITYTSMYNTMERELKERAYETNVRIGASLDSYVRTAYKLLMELSSNETIQALLQKSYPEDDSKIYSFYDDQNTAFQTMESYRGLLSMNAGLFLHRMDGNIYYDHSRKLSEESLQKNTRQWIEGYQNSGKFNAVAGPYYTNYENMPPRLAISIVRIVENFDLLSRLRKREQIGLISLEVSVEDVINEILSASSIEASTKFLIVTAEGIVVYSNTEEFEGGERLEDSLYPLLTSDQRIASQHSMDGFCFTVRRTSVLDWNVVTYTTDQDMNEAMNPIRKEVICIGIISLLIAIGLIELASQGIVASIRTIQEKLHEIEKGNFGDIIEVTTQDELGKLAESYNAVSLYLKDLVEQILRTEKERREAEIYALQSQINPHFIYNTLSTVRNMAQLQKSSGIVDMVDCLIRLLRASAQFDGRMISVQQELELIRSYVFIQQTRYMDKFDVEYKISEEILNCKMPPLLMQPIVENAIFHGVITKPGRGRSQCSCRKYSKYTRRGDVRGRYRWS